MFPNWTRDANAKPSRSAADMPKADVVRPSGSGCCGGDGKATRKVEVPSEAANDSKSKKKSCCG